MNALRTSLVLRYGVAVGVTSALMIWISVNEDGGEGLGRAVAFWGIAVTAGWLQMILVARGVRASFGEDKWPGWALLLATALVGAVPLTFEVRWLLDLIVAPESGLPPPWITFLNVSVINTVFCLVQYVLIERWPLLPVDPEAEIAPVEHPAPVGPLRPGVAMLTRPPEGLSGTIRYMRMEDHYLRVFTDDGQGLTLHRMSDAKRDLEATDGLQAHKSWWVSAAAVAEIRQENRKRIITTQDGTDIPVGRSFEPALREAGWI